MGKLRIGVMLAAVALVLGVGGATAVVSYVPLNADNTVTITPNYGASAAALSLNAQPGVAALKVFGRYGDLGATILSTGKVSLFDTDQAGPRLLVESRLDQGNVIEDRNTNTGRLQGGISNGGSLITAQNVAPAPAYMDNGQARIWFDPTPGTGGLMVTMKDSAGNVVTKQVASLS